MDIEDAPLIYGVELSACCLCPQVAETNVTRFLVATQSLRQENQIHLIEFDDENNQLDKTVFSHSSGEVWHIASSYHDPEVFSTCYSKYLDGAIHTGCKLWKLPSDESSGDSNSFDEQHANTSITEVGEINIKRNNQITHALWKPIEDDPKVMTLSEGVIELWDVADNSVLPVNSYKMPGKKGIPCAITIGKWNPHHGAKQFAIATGQHVLGWDIRTDAETFKMENIHGQLVRDLDFNPNKQYHLVTCGDDCMVKFWDVREPTAPISVIKDEHSHWVWAARFNPFHDQLVLSCGSDSRVVLYNKTSISSEPFGHLIDDDDELEVDEDVKEIPKDGLIGVYEEHEDSVYAVEWSSADPWSFASLSYDGRVVVNKVPKKIKFDILL